MTSPRPLPTGMEALGAVLDERFGNLADSNRIVTDELRALRVEVVAAKAETLLVRQELALLTAQVIQQNGNVAAIDAWRGTEEQKWREHMSAVDVQHIAVDKQDAKHDVAIAKTDARVDEIEGVRHDGAIRNSVLKQMGSLLVKGAVTGAGAGVPILGMLRFLHVI